MTKFTSKVFCEDENCPGHITVHEVEGHIVLTDDPDMPFAVVPDEA